MRQPRDSRRAKAYAAEHDFWGLTDPGHGRYWTTANAFYRGALSAAETQRAVDALLSHPDVYRRYSRAAAEGIEVRFRFRATGRATGGVYAGGRRGVSLDRYLVADRKVARWDEGFVERTHGRPGVPLWLLLHETAHALTVDLPGEPAHGPSWAACYARLVGLVYGEDAETGLRRAFSAAGVKVGVLLPLALARSAAASPRR
jgi:hypothetical protein